MILEVLGNINCPLTNHLPDGDLLLVSGTVVAHLALSFSSTNDIGSYNRKAELSQ